MRWNDLILTWRRTSGFGRRNIFMKWRISGFYLLRWKGIINECCRGNVLVLIRKGIMRWVKRGK
jgi:hypothetical protein